MQPHYRDGFIENIHYYKEGSNIIFKELFHIQRGQCCGNGCRHCPFDIKHKKGRVVVAKEFRKFIDKEDKNGSE